MKKVIYISLIIGLIIILLFNNQKEDKIIINHVSMEEALVLMEENSDYIILDVRTKEEYNEGHIPKSISIPNETIDKRVTQQLPNKDQMIFIYCYSGKRSKQAALKLKKLGYTNLIDLGGIINWQGEIVK